MGDQIPDIKSDSFFGSPLTSSQVGPRTCLRILVTNLVISSSLHEVTKFTDNKILLLLAHDECKKFVHMIVLESRKKIKQFLTPCKKRKLPFLSRDRDYV